MELLAYYHALSLTYLRNYFLSPFFCQKFADKRSCASSAMDCNLPSQCKLAEDPNSWILLRFFPQPQPISGHS